MLFQSTSPVLSAEEMMVGEYVHPRVIRSRVNSPSRFGLIPEYCHGCCLECLFSFLWDLALSRAEQRKDLLAKERAQRHPLAIPLGWVFPLDRMYQHAAQAESSRALLVGLFSASTSNGPFVCAATVVASPVVLCIAEPSAPQESCKLAVVIPRCSLVVMLIGDVKGAAVAARSVVATTVEVLFNGFNRPRTIEIHRVWSIDSLESMVECHGGREHFAEHAVM